MAQWRNTDMGWEGVSANANSLAWRDNSVGQDDSPRSTSTGASPPDVTNTSSSEVRFYGSSPTAASTAQAAAALYPGLPQTYIRYDHAPPRPARFPPERGAVVPYVPFVAMAAMSLTPVGQPPRPGRAIVRTRRRLDGDFEQLDHSLGAVGDRSLAVATPQMQGRFCGSAYFPCMVLPPPPPIRPAIMPPIRPRGSCNRLQWTDYSSAPRECKFCKNNGELKEHYRSHTLRDPVINRLVCPVLRRHICEVCGATGDDAHTKNYCPVLKERLREPLPLHLKRTCRQSDGTRRQQTD